VTGKHDDYGIVELVMRLEILRNLIPIYSWKGDIEKDEVRYEVFLF
jgi:hypothetical protein